MWIYITVSADALPSCPVQSSVYRAPVQLIRDTYPFMQLTSADTVGVVGSSHSAILVLRNLLEGEVAPKVLNLYRSPLLYAQFLPDQRIMYDNTGLKGIAADWARDKLEAGVYEKTGRLERVCVKGAPEVASAAVARCTALVHAVGFSANPLPAIIPTGGVPLPRVVHDARSGRIEGAAGIRGFGIAFPELVTDPSGSKESAVGLWKFMRHIREALMPEKKHNNRVSMWVGR